MRRYLLAIAIVLALHCGATFLVRPYSWLLVEAGSWFVRANDIADVPALLLAGFSLVGTVLVVTAIGVTYGTRAKTP